MAARRTQPPPPDIEQLAAAFAKELSKVGAEFRAAVEKLGTEAKDRAEVEFAKAVAKHPDLYRELKRTVRQVEKTAGEAAKAFGFKPKG